MRSFVVRGDQICGHADKSIAKYAPQLVAIDPFKHPAQQVQASTLIREIASTTEHYVGVIAALPHPASGYSSVREYLAASRTGIALLRDEAAKVARGDKAGLLANNDKLAAAGASARQAAKSFGFKRCVGG